MNIATDKQLREMKRLFDTLDVNKTGDISASELSLVVRGWGDTTVTDADIADIISEIDVGVSGGNGTLDFDEFVNMFTRKFTSEAKLGFDDNETHELELAFKDLDVDKDGLVSVQDLHSALLKLGAEYTQKELEEMIAEVDTTDNGCIRLEDFLAVMTP